MSKESQTKAINAGIFSSECRHRASVVTVEYVVHVEVITPLAIFDLHSTKIYNNLVDEGEINFACLKNFFQGTEVL